MTLRRTLLLLCFAALAVAVYAWNQRSTGRIIVQFERWEGWVSIISIANATNREVTVREASARELDLLILVRSEGGKLVHYSGSIMPSEKRDLMLWPMLGADLESPPHGEIHVVIVPWTDTQRLAAGKRYAAWPQPIQTWLMRKYTVRPEDRYAVHVPPPPASLQR